MDTEVVQHWYFVCHFFRGRMFSKWNFLINGKAFG